MPKIPVDECLAGPEMDAAVAKALGLKVQWRLWIDEPQPIYLAGIYADAHDDWAEHEDWRQVLPYSTDIAAAWELLPKMQSAYGILLAILHNMAECKIMKDNKPIVGRAESEEGAPLAICRAFLKANGIEYIEVLG